MGALISLLVVITLSILITRIATVALVHTGLSREMARFQARSAFTGVGFTTPESEAVTDHPVRRRIVYTLMLLGNAGVVTGVASLLLTFVRPGDATSGWTRLALVTAGVGLLWLVGSSRLVDRHLSALISRVLARLGDHPARDYESVLHLRHGYRVSELMVEEGDWLAGRDLRSCRLRREGVIVLAIKRAGGNFIGAPQPDTGIEAGDTLILYGRVEQVHRLDERKRDAGGDAEHDAEVDRQRHRVAREQADDAREHAGG